MGTPLLTMPDVIYKTTLRDPGVPVKIIEKLKEQRSIEQVTESVSEKSATEIITDNVGELNLIQLECKIKILKGNSALGKLHIELVIGSVLTEDEFWAIRKNLLDEAVSITAKQQTGLPSTMLAYVQPVSDSKNKVVYQITPEIIYEGHGILWDGNKDIVNMDDNKPRRTLFQDLNRHAVVVLEGRNLDSELSNAKAIAEALARIKQAEMKAETADEVTEKTRLAKAYNMTKIDDLQTPPDLLYAALYIKDSHQYFDSLHIDSTTSPRMKDSCGKINVGQFDPKQFFASLGQQVSEIKNQGLEDPVIDPDVAIMLEEDTLNVLSLILSQGEEEIMLGTYNTNHQKGFRRFHQKQKKSQEASPICNLQSQDRFHSSYNGSVFILQ